MILTRKIEAQPVVNGEGEWAEPAWLLRDLGLSEALLLGRQFEQAAVLWGVGRRVLLASLTPLQLQRRWVAMEPDIRSM